MERRAWGFYKVLHKDSATKVKELVIEPGRGISYQRHFKRSEMWFVSQGRICVKHAISNPEDYQQVTLEKDQFFHVKQEEWHQAFNPFNEPCHIIEIQYGEETYEDDIERISYYC